MSRRPKMLAFLLATAALAMPTAAARAADLTREAVERAEPGSSSGAADGPDAVIVKAQVLLDRAGVSPGVIDGYRGDNFRQAVAAFERRHGLEADGELDAQMWRRLDGDDGAPILKDYEITAEDVGGPFVDDIPEGFAGLAELDRVAYRGPAELLAETFHMDEDLLRALNAGSAFEEGDRILVADPGANVDAENVARIEVDKAERAIRVLGPDDDVLAFYPATIGSDEFPAPSGTLEVVGVAREPTYTFDPKKLEFGSADGVLQIAPGPNNPVGIVWIDLSKDGYGIHGTPEPAEIGKTFSHGCIRMTNWDATELAGLAKPGQSVTFID